MRDGTGRCPAHKVRAGTFADRGRGTRHERGYGTEWDKSRERVMRRDAGVCQPCLRHGAVHVGHHVDHRIPRARGGTDDDANLQCICRAAHRAKTDAEKHGLVWDEAAWCGAQAGAQAPARPLPAAPAAPGAAAGGGGGRKSGVPDQGTDRLGAFSRAGVSGGGYPCEVQP